MIWTRMRRGWLRRAIELLRWSRVVAYLAVSVAGLVALINPPLSVRDATGTANTIQLVWAAMMLISAGFCAWGAARDRWIGEYVGLIPLAGVAAVYGFSALARGVAGWAGGFFLIGFFWILVSRWQEVALLRAEAERLRRHPPHDDEQEDRP